VLLTDALEIHFIDMVKFRRLLEKILRMMRCTGSWHGLTRSLVEEVIKMNMGYKRPKKRWRISQATKRIFVIPDAGDGSVGLD
jgi:hypothetical protein